MLLETATIAITMDEKCLWLKEEDRLTTDGRHWHRFQEIRVMRGERPATFEWDMGPRKLYNRAAVFVPTGVVHLNNGDVLASDDKVPWEQVRRYEPLYRVGDAMDIADELRSEAPNEDLLPEPIDLIRGYLDRAEEMVKWRKYRSTFGPRGSLVRN